MQIEGGVRPTFLMIAVSADIAAFLIWAQGYARLAQITLSH
jgi:hypothetical protein